MQEAAVDILKINPLNCSKTPCSKGELPWLEHDTKEREVQNVVDKQNTCIYCIFVDYLNFTELYRYKLRFEDDNFHRPRVTVNVNFTNHGCILSVFPIHTRNYGETSSRPCSYRLVVNEGKKGRIPWLADHRYCSSIEVCFLIF